MPTERPSLQERVRFGIDYTFFLNLAFAAAWLFYLHFSGGQGQRRQQEHRGSPLGCERFAGSLASLVRDMDGKEHHQFRGETQ